MNPMTTEQATWLAKVIQHQFDQKTRESALAGIIMLHVVVNGGLHREHPGLFDQAIACAYPWLALWHDSSHCLTTGNMSKDPVVFLGLITGLAHARPPKDGG